MTCKYCGYEEINDAIFCSDCGSPFYIIFYPSVIYSSHGKIDFNLECVNNGIKNFRLLSVQLKNYKIDENIPALINPGNRQPAFFKINWNILCSWFRFLASKNFAMDDFNHGK